MPVRDHQRFALEHAKHTDAMAVVDGIAWPCLHCWITRAGGYPRVDWSAFDSAYARARAEMLTKNPAPPATKKETGMHISGWTAVASWPGNRPGWLEWMKIERRLP